MRSVPGLLGHFEMARLTHFVDIVPLDPYLRDAAVLEFENTDE
jgi:hypothetical protein